MKIITCANCQLEFDLNSPAKIRAGGKINQCPECSSEDVVRYVGLQAADGKQSQITILSFEDKEDKIKYMHFWQNNTGLHKGKSGSQINKSISTTPNVKFKTINSFNPTNHKGRA